MTARRLFCWAAVAVTFLVYLPSLRNGFAMDDLLIARGVFETGLPNPFVVELDLPRIFGSHYWAACVENDTLYRPITMLSYALRFAVFGDAPVAAHAINLALHLWAVWLVARICARLGATPLAAALAAAVFGVHALHTEVVAGIVGRAELFAFCFGAEAMLLLARPGRIGVATKLAALSLLFLAFGSKESALAWWPFTVLFVLLVPVGLDRPRWRAASAVAAWTLLPVAAFFLLRTHMLAGLPGIPEPAPFSSNPLAHVDTTVRIVTAIRLLGTGVWLSIAPFDLASDYGAMVFELGGARSIGFLASLATLVILLGLFVVARRRSPMVALAIAAWLGFSLITSNLLFPIGTMFAERLWYAPSLAISLLAAAGVTAALRHGTWMQRIGVGLVLAWIATNAALTWTRGPVWRNDATLYTTDVLRRPRSVKLHLAVSSLYRAAQQPGLARAHIDRALELDPECAIAWNNRAALQYATGDKASAEQSFRHALDAKHLVGHHIEPAIHASLGQILAERGATQAALAELLASLRRDPDFVEAWRILEELRTNNKLAPGPIAAGLRELARQQPTRCEWNGYLGLLARKEHPTQARARLRTAIARLPRGGRYAELRSLLQIALFETWPRANREPSALAVARDLADDKLAPPAARAHARRYRDGG